MRHGSLFSGIGGFDLAAEWMGWENIFHCEWNKFGQKVLKYYWPNSISYNDITKTDFTIHRGAIDILTGGFPCQPYSQAGKRLGKEDERHLCPEMLRAIREIKPTWVVGENVLGLVNWNGGLVFDEVQTDLEAEGYEVQPFILPAASVNAPHRRDRVWFVAFKDTLRCRCPHGKPVEKGTEIRELRDVGSGDKERICIEADAESFTNSEQSRLQRYSDSRNVSIEEGKMGRKRGKSAIEFTSIYNESNATDTNGIGLRRESNWVRKSGFISENEQANYWENFPTQSPVCNGDDGLSTELLRQAIREDCNGHITEKEIDKIIHKAFVEWRNESIKAGGNAIVPQVVLQIFKAIELYEQPNRI